MTESISTLCYCEKPLTVQETEAEAWTCHNCLKQQTYGTHHQCGASKNNCVYLQVTGQSFVVCPACLSAPTSDEADDNKAEVKEGDAPTQSILFQKLMHSIRMMS